MALGPEIFVWPGAVVVIAGTAMVICRKQLRGLVDRITKIDKSGITAVPQAVARVGETEVLPDSRELMEVNFNEVVRQQENHIKCQLGKIKFNSIEEREPFLIRALARSEVFATFDRLSLIIYGSQLELMVACNGLPGGIPEEPVRENFAKLKAADPVFHERTTWESWIGFLLEAGFLIREGAVLKITLRGREFLKFLVDTGSTQRRRG